MNYSESEISNNRTDEESLVQAGMQLLPVIAKALFSAISDLGNDFGLTPAQVKVLLQLGSRRQMTVGEIAAALDCSMPAASELVDRLVDAGHLLPASDPADRRRELIAATPAPERIRTHLRERRFTFRRDGFSSRRHSRAPTYYEQRDREPPPINSCARYRLDDRRLIPA